MSRLYECPRLIGGERRTNHFGRPVRQTEGLFSTGSRTETHSGVGRQMAQGGLGYVPDEAIRGWLAQFSCGDRVICRVNEDRQNGIGIRRRKNFRGSLDLFKEG